MRLLRRIFWHYRPKPPRVRDIVIEVLEHGATRWKVESYNSNVTQAAAERRAWEALDTNRDKYDKARLMDEHSGELLNTLMFGKGGRADPGVEP